MDEAPSPSEIRALRGARSRAEFGALVGVTGLTVYRWELPPGAPEARRPRGRVLERLRAYIAAQAFAPAAPAFAPAAPAASPPPVPLPEEELAALAPAVAAMGDCQLSRAEGTLVALVAAGALRSGAARAYAAALLARIQILARHDTRSAFATLLGAGAEGDLAQLPAAVQIEVHATAAFLYAHPDAQLFNPGKTNHHVALAEGLLGQARGDHGFFLWLARFLAAVSLYDTALIARAMEGFSAAQELATTPLHRCLAEEAATIASLGLTSTAEATRRIEAFRALAEARGLPLQQVRAMIWRAEVLVEEAAPPAEILALLDEADRLQQRHRIAVGLHAMLLRRNRGEALMRLGRRREAEEVLLDAARVGAELAYTPIRIFTTLVRLHLLTDRVDDVAKIAAASLAAEDVQRDLTRAFGRVVAVLCDLFRGDAASDWCDRLVAHLGELRRLGVWPVAYRHLVLVSLGLAAAKGAAGDAERLLQVAERAVEWSASPTASAAYRRHRAAVLTRRGRFTEARQALAAALATFEASGDVTEAALVRRALANVDLLDGAPEAERRLRETEAALAALELDAPPLLRADAALEDEPALAPPARGAASVGLGALVVPLQRLATRGVGEAFLERELVSIAGELLPGRHVRLEQVDASGRAVALATREGTGSAPLAWLEFSDGAGRRLRLGVGDGLDVDERAALEIVVGTAALAFEIAALRGLSTRPRAGAASPAAETEPPALSAFVAASPAMRRLKSELGRLSGSRATIIVTGESGTGKEVVARAIHDLSRRAGGPYVTFNSAAVPRELFEGQLFGYKKGAFTGATTDHPGVIRSAEGGTLFLDEIGELPLDVQPKLLRFLENGEVLPLGERRPVQVDVRVIAATHRDLLQLVRERRFREDLYYRLQVIPVLIPPLRERREDVVALARHFIAKMTPDGARAPVLGPDGEARLLAHAWPGNVRELRNVVERCMAFDPLPRLIGAAELRI